MAKGGFEGGFTGVDTALGQIPVVLASDVAQQQFAIPVQDHDTATQTFGIEERHGPAHTHAPSLARACRFDRVNSAQKACEIASGQVLRMTGDFVAIFFATVFLTAAFFVVGDFFTAAFFGFIAAAIASKPRIKGMPRTAGATSTLCARS